MRDLTDVVETALDEPVVYVVGSGISIPYPSCLPSAADMIDLTLDVVAPDSASSEEREAVTSALPELFYEGLYHVAGDRAVAPWRLLHPDVQPSDRLGHDLGPNRGHLAIVYLAWRHGLPVVTTNFDLFFERAAEALGLTPVVSHPDTPDGYRLASSDQQQVAIWKLHGTVDSPSSICTTLQRISRYDGSLVAKLRRLFEEHRSCLLAYSGRDIDLFPFIASFADPSAHRPTWICLDFGPNHAVHTVPGRFRTMEGGTDRLAGELASRLTDRSDPARRLQRAAEHRGTREDARPRRDCRQAERAFRRVGGQLIADELGGVFEVPGTRELAFGISLLGVDRYPAARNYLERALGYLPPGEGRHRARAHLLLSSCHHNLSKYEQAAAHAVQAGAVASEAGCRREALESLAQRDEALRMQHLPRLGVEDWRNLLHVGAHWTVVRFVVDAGRLSRGWTRAEEADASAATTLGNTFTEHLIRLLALVQGALGWLPMKALRRRALRPAWTRLREFSHRIGYAAGVGNAQKYLSRLGEGGSGSADPRGGDGQADVVYDILTSERVFDHISHHHALGIVARDRAERHRAEGDLDEAVEEYRRCVEWAREVDNRSLELKGHLGLARTGTPVDCERVRDLLDEIEGAGYRARDGEILEYAGCGE